MPNKNYINRFWKFNQEYKLGANVIAMFFYLINEKKKQFSLSDKELAKNLCLHRNTVPVVRKKLIEHNIISVYFKKGVSPVYQLLIEESDEEIVKPNDTLFKEKSKVKVLLNPINIVVETTTEKKEDENLIPTFNEVISFAKTLPNYDNSLEKAIKEKYEFWKSKGWKNNQGRPIIDYKATLKATLPFLKKEIEEVKLQTINRPK